MICRVWAVKDVNLMKGFRYYLELLYYGNGLYPDFFRLGVRFPDSTEVKPIDNRFLRRSMGEPKFVLLNPSTHI